MKKGFLIVLLVLSFCVGCQSSDTKKPYTYRNRKVGVNFPPLHPNCRSTTSAWVSEELLAKITRTAKDENGNVYQIPGKMTYREWEKE